MGAIFVVVALIASCAYAISAWQVFGFAEHVWRLPNELCFAAAFVADLLSLCGLFATYQLRKAKWFVQAYAWFVFAAMTGLSVAAAESYATWRFAPANAKPDVVIDARVASAAIVIALSLAVHLLIICRNHIATAEAPPARPRAAKAAKVPSEPEGKTEKQDATEPMPVDVPDRAPTGTDQGKGLGRRGRQVDPATHDHHDRVAAAVIAKKLTAKAAATEQGVSERAVQNWVKAYRERQSRTPSATIELGPDDRPADQQERPQLVEEVTA